MKRFYSQLILLSFFVFILGVLPVSVFAQPEIQKHRAELKNRVERFHQARRDAENRPSILNQSEQKLDTFELRKDILLRAIDSLAKHAELTRERLANFPVVEEQLRASIEKEIALDITSLQDFRLRVQHAATQDELRELADELKEHRKEMIEEKIRKLMVLAQIELFEQRVLETASARALLIQGTLPVAPELDTLLKDALSKIAETSTILQKLKEDVHTEEINEATMSEVRSTLKTATNTMRDVYKIFRSITFW